MILEFIRNHILCVVLVVLGLLLVFGNYYIILTNRRHKTHVSGIPFLGGLMIAIGFLTTPYKPLALLGLLDPSICGLFISIYYCKSDTPVLVKRYEGFLRQKHLCPSRSVPEWKIVSVIHYEGRETPHEEEFPYITNTPFQIGYPWAVIIVVEEPISDEGAETDGAALPADVSAPAADAPATTTDSEAASAPVKRSLILDTGTDENLKKIDPEKIRILPFDDGKIELHDIADYLKGDVCIRLVKND